MRELKVKILENEYWWGGCVVDGPNMPYGRDSKACRDLRVNNTPNQAVPLLLSNQGRYIWSDKGFLYIFEDGEISLETENSEIILGQDGSTLRESFLGASKRFFPPDGRMVGELLFEKPQYNTWIELMFEQNQEDVIEYAKNIINNGLPTGVLMIDDCWQEDYGVWRFQPGRFPDPKKMVDELHAMGFFVMLWSCPFVSPDHLVYRYLRDNKYLVLDKSGEPSIKKWWNGYSAVLDFTNPEAVAWYAAQNQWLMDTYGIDGFKLDAGDASFYDKDDITYGLTDPNDQSELWAKFGLNYKYNEYRACWKCGGLALAQRLCDKNHAWDKHTGVASLVPSQLVQGLIGYAYGCPDMIGGGEY